MTVSWVDTAVLPGDEYSYAVEAANVSGASAESTPAGIQIPVPPPTGLALMGKLQAYSVGLKWKPSSGAVTYGVYRGGVLIGTSTTASYTDTTVAPLTTYLYQVDVTTTAATSALSTPALSVTTPDAIPAVPTGLYATDVTSSGLNLAWDTDPLATSYILYQSGNPLTGPFDPMVDTVLASAQGSGTSHAALEVPLTGLLEAIANGTPIRLGGAAGQTVICSQAGVVGDTVIHTAPYTTTQNYPLGTRVQAMVAIAGLLANHTYLFSIEGVDSVGHSVKSASITVKTAAA